MYIEALMVPWLPSWRAVWFGGPLLLSWSASCLWIAARMKRRWGLATGYTRKVFHVLTFTSAGALHVAGGLGLVCLFGVTTTLVIAYALLRGTGHPFYEALAREADAPNRTHYVVVSYFATLIGGLLSNLVVGSFALCGYLVCGLGDAAGEPIGTRWGRHWYRVPSRPGTIAKRSVEGSLGVFLVSALALLAAIAALMGGEHVLRTWDSLLVISATCAAVEAFSPHGWDNATLQVTPSLMAASLLGQ